jgi:hypothetical protein
LAILTHSRTAAAAFAASALIAFAVSPARLRTVFYLVVPAVLILYSSPPLERFWLEGPASLQGGAAAWNLLLSFLVAAFAGMVLSLLEGWVRVTPRLKVVFGVLLLAALLAGLVRGWGWLSQEVGDPVEWALGSSILDVGEAARGPSAPEDQGGFENRRALWQAAWQDFITAPLTGVGAGAFAESHAPEDSTPGNAPDEASSIVPEVLAETGLPGALLLLAAVALSLGGVAWPRFAAGWQALRRRGGGRWGADPVHHGWSLSLAIGFVFWLIHASVESLLDQPAVTLAALFLLVLALAEVDGRAEVMWPGLAGRLALLGAGHPAPPPVSHEQEKPHKGPGRGGTARDRSLPSLSPFRRSDRYQDRRLRRLRRDERRARVRARLVPPGPLSQAFRWSALGLCAGLLAGLSLIWAVLI